MSIQFKDFGFYNIDVPYLKYLHENIDKEIYYTSKKPYEKKPFLGILVLIDSYTYFIPFTSAKPKHATWRKVDKAHYLIYEVIDKSKVQQRDIVKAYSEDKLLKLLAALDIRKMIPVPNGLYQRVDFQAVQDLRYRRLLTKELRFCENIQDGILAKAQKVYNEQKTTGKVYKFYCNFTALEQACDDYLTDESTFSETTE